MTAPFPTPLEAPGRIGTPKAVLVRLPNSHRGQDGVERFLGYRPHSWRSFQREGSFAYLPAADAQRLLADKRVTKPREQKHFGELHPCWNQPDPFRGLPPKDERCEHPLERRTQYPQHPEHGYCCECGKSLPL